MSESERSEQVEATHAGATPTKSPQTEGQGEGAGMPGACAATTPSEPAALADAGRSVAADVGALNELPGPVGGREHESATTSLRSPTPEAVSAPTLDVDRDDDEETWTNQPARGGDAPRDDADFDEEGDLDEEEDGGVELDEPAPVARKPIQNARDVVCEELPYRAARAKTRLRPHLSGTIVIELAPSRDRFLFDWRTEEARVSPVAAPVSLAHNEPADESKVDAIISVHEQHLMQIRSGDLNPQLAILADKVRVAGKVAPAVYLFNLIAPRDREL